MRGRGERNGQTPEHQVSCVGLVRHTHKANMILYRPKDGRPMLLMDVGAWIEKCKYPIRENGPTKVAPAEPSAQLCVIHGNDARIYQVRFRAGA